MMEFLSLSPRTVSGGFRVRSTFGIDYRHQAIATTEVPGILEERISAGLAEEVAPGEIFAVTVQFKEAGASSLDYIVFADFAGSAAPNRGLLERAIQMVHSEQAEIYGAQAEQMAEDRILDSLLPRPVAGPMIDTQQIQEQEERYERTRSKLREQLKAGGLEERQIEIKVEERAPSVPILSNVGFDQMEPEMQNFMERLMPSKSVGRRVTVAEAREILQQQELDKLIDREAMIDTAIQRTEETGIVFVDEIDTAFKFS